jgi:hypothetical protein
LRRRRKKQHPRTMAIAPKIERGTPTPIAIFLPRDMPDSSDAEGAMGTELLGLAVDALLVLPEIVTNEVTNLVVGVRLALDEELVRGD